MNYELINSLLITLYNTENIQISLPGFIHNHPYIPFRLISAAALEKDDNDLTIETIVSSGIQELNRIYLFKKQHKLPHSLPY